MTDIRETLKENVAMVTFTKKDGTERVMKATLKEEFLPASTSTTESARKVNPEVLPVFDLDNNAWRSFRLDSVKNVEIVE